MKQLDTFFIWKGRESKDFNIMIVELPPVGTFERQIEKKEVQGRDGFLTKDYGAARGDVYPVECYIDNDCDIDSIKAWLTGTDKLQLSHSMDRYYNATIINKVDFAQVIEPLKSILIQFELQPYGYLLDGEEVVTITENNTIMWNKGNYKSTPYVKITGSGAVNFYINDQVIQFSEIDSYVEFDSELDTVFKATIPKESTATGDTPILEIGENNIHWSGTGTVTKVEIIPRWRCY